MTDPATITPAIIDALYEESLLLAEEARMVFESHDDAVTPPGHGASEARIARSCEALRTTTRMMHAIAWLLNHRAYFAGEMSELQLRRHGRLPPAQPEGDPAQLALLDLETSVIVERSRTFFARVERLDAAWRAEYADEQAAIHQLRERLGAAFAG